MKTLFLNFKQIIGFALITSASATWADINLASGNFNHSQVDYQNFAEPELTITRNYNSANAESPANLSPFISRGWSLSFLSEQLYVQRNYTVYTEIYGPYADNGSGYSKTRTYPWLGHAIVYGGAGEQLSLLSRGGVWTSLSDSKAVITCNNPTSYYMVPVQTNIE